MTATMCREIGNVFPLEELDSGEYSVQKLKGMTFHIRSFAAQGLGHVSLMTASGFFGLMKMDTLIINPLNKDMPLFSYDRVLAMGNDTLIFELYDTCLTKSDLSALTDVQQASPGFDHDLGEHWYDSIKLPESVAKKGKKQQRAAFDRLATDYLHTYLTIAKDAPSCADSLKREKASVYVEGLLANGGPSTDVFLKGIGADKTQQLFRSVLFGTQPK